jgi:hypothetical protein
MYKLSRDLLRATRPLVEAVGGTIVTDHTRLTRHEALIIRLNDQERWVPYSTSHDMPEAVIYHTRKKVEAALREMLSGNSIDRRDPRKRY